MSLHLEVVTPRGMVVKTEVESVRLPGKVGEFAVLEGHIPLLSALAATTRMMAPPVTATSSPLPSDCSEVTYSTR